MKVKSLSHVGITVKNFEKSVKWYWEHFKMPLLSIGTMTENEIEKMEKLYGLKDTSVKFGFLRCPKGGVIEIFEFSKTLPPESIWNRCGTSHLTLDVKNVKKWHQYLSGKGVDFLCKPQTTDGTEWAFLKDPDGNLIELIDLKFNYFAIRKLGSLAGFFMRKNKYKKYYR